MYLHAKCVPLSWQSFKWSTAPTDGELVGVEVVGDMLGTEDGGVLGMVDGKVLGMKDGITLGVKDGRSLDIEDGDVLGMEDSDSQGNEDGIGEVLGNTSHGGVLSVFIVFVK